MHILNFGINNDHGKGEFCFKKKFNAYFISYFITPFLYELDGIIYKGNAGEMLIMPPDTYVYHGAVNSDSSFMNDWAYISGDDFGQLLNDYPLPLNTPFHCEYDLIMKDCLSKVKDELNLSPDGYEIMTDTYITQMYLTAYRLYKKIKTDISYSKIEEARKIIFENYGKKWTVADMALLCGYSQSHFSALYQKRYSVSPIEDLLNLRISVAKKMLVFNGLSVGEISEKCGFSSIYYFSKYFKRITGQSPTEYASK